MLVRFTGLILGVLLLLGALPPTVHSSYDGTAGAGGGGEALEEMVITGSWRGAKLRCRKEEGKAVRCGKPEPFEVIFNGDGTGTSADERFPQAFTYSMSSPTEITIRPDDGSDELKLFQLELAEGFLTFQAYVYLPLDDPNLPAEVNYIHYIFDVSRTE